MGLFDKLREPVFLKQNSDLEKQIEALKAIEPTLNQEGKEKIRQDLKFLEYGLAGEKNIEFELKNSHMPMYVLHDIYLNSEGLSAQIDYLVFTRTLCFVIECKNLYGNVEINGAGDFVRSMEFAGKVKKEGIYSPITQNKRHLEMMKKIKREKRNNPLTKFMHDKWFEDSYRTVVVLANPKTVLNAKYAKKDVRNQVIRADQLIAYIREECKKSKEGALSDESLLNWASSYLRLHVERIQDFGVKYAENVISEPTVTSNLLTIEPIETVVEDLPVYKELKAFRLIRSREENIKAYLIFNDNQLKDLVSKMPTTAAELQLVSGFGPLKVEKYGESILEIVGRFR